jgi:TM2 domain-containing membrane protein YozV
VQVVVNVGGAAVPGPAVAVPAGEPRSKLAAGLLGIFLGFLGVHRFYLGYSTLGAIMLCLTVFTCGYGAIVTGLWGLVEGILILTGTINRDAYGRALRE